MENKYKLNLYQPNGLLRVEFSRGSFRIMSTKWGDVIRAISGSKWASGKEIIGYYRVLEKKLRFEYNRTDEQLMVALKELVDAGMVQKK